MYDDGGFSGGTMERPALRRLLADVEAGKIDVVVVYKVDRLTRALSDFAKIIEVFDRRGVSFVSVTQQFNTTTSMGRLTLNVLLSFAQFEREVTGERIRDKIAASKKKGMWMGGLPPLGYDVKDRKLMVNDAEVKTVLHIFRRYRELRSVRLLKADLDAAGIVSKYRRAADGSAYGGKSLARGALYLMIQNRLYRGEIVHKDKSYPGEHKAIVEKDLWDDVQAILAENRVRRETGAGAKEPSLLGGLLVDSCGNRLTLTHATKKGIRYRYYVSGNLITGAARDACAGLRLPAASLETLVARRICDWLKDSAAMLDAVGQRVSGAAEQKRLVAEAGRLSAAWPSLAKAELRNFLRSICRRIQVHTDKVDVTLDLTRFICRLHAEFDRTQSPEETCADHDVTLTIPARLRRTGMEMKLVIDNGSDPANTDSGLIKILVRAYGIRDQLLQDSSLSPNDIAEREGVVPSYVTRVFRLAFLAPDIIEAILQGKQPPELSVRKLMDDTRLPLNWNEQRVRLGFASTPTRH
jgi:site-specific DNA recombinase